MEIPHFKPALPHEGHVAEFSIYIPQWNVTFHRYKVRKSQKGHLFIAAPSFSEDMGDGEKKWTNFIEFSKEKKSDFEKKVMELITPLLDNIQKGNMEDVPF